MIHHIVLFKTAESAAPEARKEMTAGLQSLQKEIPAIRYIRAGLNFSDRSQGFDTLLYSTFENKTLLDEYQVHPAHKREVAERVKPIMEDILVGDFESEVEEKDSKVIHAVLFKFKPDTDAGAIDLAAQKLNALQGVIPEIDFITVGRNFSDRGKGHELVLISGFASVDALTGYGIHPAHTEVVNTYIKPIIAGLTVGDFETE